MYDELIIDEDSFLNECKAAKQILDYVEASEYSTDQVRWFFDKCYAYWKENRFAALFKSFDGLEYEGFVFSVEATKADDDWVIRTVKVVTEKQ